MDFRIESGAPVAAEVRRIAHEQTTAALDGLADVDRGDAVARIHDSRKRCKKVRGLVRLVRPALGRHYAIANETYRDAARELSQYRDAQALLGTFDELLDVAGGHLAADRAAPVRERLVEESDRATSDVDGTAAPIGRALNLLEEARAQINEWSLDATGWDAVVGGLQKTYRRGSVALEHAVVSPTAESFHDLRKRAKYTWYHHRLLEATAPSILQPLSKVWHDLSDSLGDAHDLAVLADRLLGDPDAHGGADAVDAVMVVLDGHRVDLERRSVALAERLYAEKPKHFARRLGAYWSTWEEHGTERPAGEIAEVFDVGAAS